LILKSEEKGSQIMFSVSSLKDEENEITKSASENSKSTSKTALWEEGLS
jgi:hypothetical protein